jgi:N6-L-threonylcarbamoyladenine synthase
MLMINILIEHYKDDIMAILGIESSAHTFGVGVVENGKVLANEKMMFDIGDQGIIPAKAADFHAGNASSVISTALSKAKLKISDITGVGYTKGPGLGPCLRIGQLAARTIAQQNSIPIVPVNHAVAHIEVTRHISGAKDPLVLYVSGGNSQILGLIDEPFRHYHIFGETFDIGVGNMLDSFARAAKLKPAWGSSVAKLAENGKYITMPYTVKGMDFTFTGLLTHATKALSSNSPKDVAFSIQENSFAMLCEATERALLLTKKKEILLSGGVAQSKRLNEMMRLMASPHKVSIHTAPNELNADNGAMIALVAEKMLNSGIKENLDNCDINQKYRIDSVKVAWQ